jgi:hypothetical protein
MDDACDATCGAMQAIRVTVMRISTHTMTCAGREHARLCWCTQWWRHYSAVRRRSMLCECAPPSSSCCCRGGAYDHWHRASGSFIRGSALRHRQRRRYIRQRQRQRRRERCAVPCRAPPSHPHLLPSFHLTFSLACPLLRLSLPPSSCLCRHVVAAAVRVADTGTYMWSMLLREL